MMTLKKLLLILWLVCINSSGFCADLDDGLGLGEPIVDEIKTGINVQFIRRNAVAKVRRKAKKAEEGTQGLEGGEGVEADADAEALECDGAGNINIGPGTDLSGVRTIVNVSTNKGTTTVCN